MTTRVKWLIEEILQDAKLHRINTNGPYLILDKILLDYYREWDRDTEKK